MENKPDAVEEKKSVEVNNKQLTLMRDALEFYSRFLSGQFDALPDALKWRVNQSETAQEALRLLKASVFPELHPNESYGIGYKEGDYLSEQRQIAYEMYRQIYVYQTRQRKLAGEDVSWNVYDSQTLKYSNEPLMTVFDSSHLAESRAEVEKIREVYERFKVREVEFDPLARHLLVDELKTILEGE